MIHYILDKNKASLTHKCVLDLPGLPEQTRESHVVPGLTSYSLMSVVILCNARYNMIFAKVNVKGSIYIEAKLSSQAETATRQH